MRIRNGLILITAAVCLCGTAMAQDRVEEKRRELQAIETELGTAQEDRIEIEAEIEVLTKDRAALNTRLVETAALVQSREGEVTALESRLEDLGIRQQDLREALEERRGLLAHLLAALQRMGQNPPPALVVHPQDALSAIRSAIALGAVVPQMRGEAEALVADIEELSDVAASIVRDKSALEAEKSELVRQQARLALLTEIRKRQIESERKSLAELQARSEQLASRAESFNELIASMEAEIDAFRQTRASNAAALAATAEDGGAPLSGERMESYFEQKAREEAAAKKAAEAARKAMELAKLEAEAARKAAEAEAEAEATARPPEPANPLIASTDPNRITPALPFTEARGLLPLPARGQLVADFGDDTGYGEVSQGVSIATRPDAQIVAPSDGWIVYSGPFRSYRQLLIIDAGEGYHVVLAGMDRIDVGPGQFVLAGEPVGAMGGEAQVVSTSVLTDGFSQPVLYVEMRKDGQAIDPTPWWADRTTGQG